MFMLCYSSFTVLVSWRQTSTILLPLSICFISLSFRCFCQGHIVNLPSRCSFYTTSPLLDIFYVSLHLQIFCFVLFFLNLKSVNAFNIEIFTRSLCSHHSSVFWRSFYHLDAASHGCKCFIYKTKQAKNNSGCTSYWWNNYNTTKKTPHILLKIRMILLKDQFVTFQSDLLVWNWIKITYVCF